MAEKPPGSDKPKTRRRTQRLQTGTAGQTGPTPETQTLPACSATLSGAAQPSQSDSGAEPREQKIRRRAYELWEQDGRPAGRDDDYWHRAEREIDVESADRS